MGGGDNEICYLDYSVDFDKSEKSKKRKKEEEKESSSNLGYSQSFKEESKLFYWIKLLSRISYT